MERLTYFKNGHWRLNFDGCQYNARFVDRLAAYENTGLMPGEVAELQALLQGCESKKSAELVRFQELAEADKDGRVMVLPCKPGGSMLDMSDIEHPKIMKRICPAVAYESIRGIVFHQPYGVFLENIAAGYIRPLSKETEAKLKEVQKDG